MPRLIFAFGSSPAPLLVAFGVGHPAKHAAAAKSGPWLRIASDNPPSKVRTPLLARAAVGVGRPEEPVPDVRRTDARRRKRDGPEGVFQGFQVSVYKVDPRVDSLARNLLSKDDWRAALRDEPGKIWPEVTVIRKPSSRACRAERLAGTTAGPDRPGIVPTSSSKSV